MEHGNIEHVGKNETWKIEQWENGTNWKHGNNIILQKWKNGQKLKKWKDNTCKLKIFLLAFKPSVKYSP